jgi:hypothetical protein
MSPFLYICRFLYLSVLFDLYLFSDAESQASQASLLSDRDVVNKIKCLIDIERKLRLELGEHEKKVNYFFTLSEF